MSRRIEPRPHRLGTPDHHEPEKIDELRERQEKHTRLIAGKPARAFSEVLSQRMKKLRGEDEPKEEEEGESEEKEALLALHPAQAPGLANKKKVIVKG